MAGPNAASGRYEDVRTGDEEFRAFIPNPLPPSASVHHDPELRPLLERAALALGRLDGAFSVLPDTNLFLYSYVRQEAVLSSQIEGTQSSLSDLLAHEQGAAAGVPIDDVAEVSNYVAALEYAISQLSDPAGLPLCNRLVRNAHAMLSKSGRGAQQMPGEFRVTQNWVGGSRPGNAAFVPTPPV